MNTGIYALSSGYGKCAISVLRVVKQDILNDIIPFINKKTIKPRYATLVKLYKDKEHKKLIDNCIMIFFSSFNSYSGLDTIEFHLHGSLFIIKEVYNLLETLGYREAEPGEFSKLAVLNGKMDLIQAEAINNLINSESQTAYENSLKNLGKEFSEKLKEYENAILQISSFLEASLEYPEEDLDEDKNIINDIYNQFDFLKSELSKIINVSSYSISLHSKFNIVVIGPTNSGKSSLFNYLLKEDRSIVSDVHGTTRDYIESDLSLGNLHISIYDTAGLRESDDKIEKIGIQRVKKLIENSDYLIFLISIDSNLDDDLIEIFNNNKEKIITVINKIDLIFGKIQLQKDLEIKDIIEKIIVSEFTNTSVKNFIESKINKNIIPISVESDFGIKYLENLLKEKLELKVDYKMKKEDEDYLFIQTIRQKNLLEQVLKYIIEAEKDIREKGLYDLAAENLRNSYLKINELTGKEYSEDLFNIVFSKFCLGK